MADIGIVSETTRIDDRILIILNGLHKNDIYLSERLNGRKPSWFLPEYGG